MRTEEKRTVPLWDTRTLTDKIMIFGYESQQDRNNYDILRDYPVVDQVFEAHEYHLISLHEINDNRKGMTGLLNTPEIPDINRIELYRIEEIDGKLIKKTVRVSFGNCEIQRARWAYNYDSRTHTRIARNYEGDIREPQPERTPTNLGNFKRDPKFIYDFRFRCALCESHRTMSIKTRRKRKTPVCKHHGHPLILTEILRKRGPSKKWKESKARRNWRIIYSIYRAI